MIKVRELSRGISGRLIKKRFLLLLHYYCDESYDSDPSQGRGGTFVVGGFLTKDTAWSRIERRWLACNKRNGVLQYHARDVNGRRGEFQGWSDAKRNKYSKTMLQILKDQGLKLCGISCGISKIDYERLISESGRSKWGSPYTVAFKNCIAWVAQIMEKIPPEHRFAVVVARSQFQKEAGDAFEIMKANKSWPMHKRLGSFALDDPDSVVPLQAADMIAYETFRLMEHGGLKRRALAEIFPHNQILSTRYLEKELHKMGPEVERSAVGNNEFVPSFSDSDIVRELLNPLIGTTNGKTAK